MQYLFIVTHGRSGSTALMRALNALPGWCIRGENAGILRPMVEALQIARSNAHWHTTAYGPGDPWYGADLGRPDRLRQRLARGLVQDILCPPEGTRVAGFKEIRYMADDLHEDLYRAMIRFLLQDIGAARLVLLTRDATATARSGWFREMPCERALDQIRRTQARLRATAERHPQKSFLIDHADFDGNPEGLRPLLDWLGEAMPAAALQAALAPRLTHAQEPGK